MRTIFAISLIALTAGCGASPMGAEAPELDDEGVEFYESHDAAVAALAADDLGYRFKRADRDKLVADFLQNRDKYMASPEEPSPGGLNQAIMDLGSDGQIILR
jgi:hypothetical protein